MCTDDSDCNHHGTCSNDGCDCAPNYFGDHCVPLVQYIGTPYLIVFYIVLAIYVILLMFAFWKLYKFYRVYLKQKELSIRHVTVSILTLGLIGMFSDKFQFLDNI